MPEPAPGPVGSPGAVRGVLGRAVRVLTAFTMEDTSLSFSELLRRTDLPRATVHRLLGELVESGLLEREDHRYRLSGLVFELGMRASVERLLLEVAVPHLQALCERTHETTHLGIRQGREVVYLAKIAPLRQAEIPSRVGGRMPLHATAIGKVLLAAAAPDERARLLGARLVRHTPRTITAPGLLGRHLLAVREKGHAFEFEESTVGIGCVAAPVPGADGRVLAAVSITGPLARFDPHRHVDDVTRAAAGVAAALHRRSVLS